MALDNTDKIDFIGIAPDGYCVLTIADTNDWLDPDAHIETLKAKLNTYVNFIESGDIDRAYPDRGASPCRIIVALRETPPPSSTNFFDLALETISGRGIEFSWQVFHDD